MNHKSTVLKQIAFGIALIILLGLIFWFVFPDTLNTERVPYTLSWSVLFSIPLFFGIHSTLFQRFNSGDLIKGHLSTGQLGFHGAYLSNTLEQTVVNALTAVSLGMVAPIEFVKLVPIQASIYILGRALFFFTYKKNPMYRFAGFAVGYYVAAISLVLTICWSF